MGDISLQTFDAPRFLHQLLGIIGQVNFAEFVLLLYMTGRGGHAGRVRRSLLSPDLQKSLPPQSLSPRLDDGQYERKDGHGRCHSVKVNRVTHRERMCFSLYI